MFEICEEQQNSRKRGQNESKAKIWLQNTNSFDSVCSDFSTPKKWLLTLQSEIGAAIWCIH